MKFDCSDIKSEKTSGLAGFLAKCCSFVDSSNTEGGFFLCIYKGTPLPGQIEGPDSGDLKVNWENKIKVYQTETCTKGNNLNFKEFTINSSK